MPLKCTYIRKLPRMLSHELKWSRSSCLIGGSQLRSLKRSQSRAGFDFAGSQRYRRAIVAMRIATIATIAQSGSSLIRSGVLSMLVERLWWLWWRVRFENTQLFCFDCFWRSPPCSEKKFTRVDLQTTPIGRVSYITIYLCYFCFRW